MSTLITNTNQNEELTISSKEISELTSKQHKNVIADCDKLNETYKSLGLAEISAGLYQDTYGRNQKAMMLTKMQSLDLMTGYSTALRIKVNRRWEELEQQVSQPIPQYPIPQTFAEALMLAGQEMKRAEEAENKLAQVTEVAKEQAQQLTLATDKINVATKTIEEYRPQVEYAKAVKNDGDSCLVNHLANIITQSTPYAVGQNRLYEFLRDIKFLGSSGERHNKPYQEYIERGYFELKYSEYNDPKTGKTKYGSVTKVTPKGQEKIIDIYVKAQAL